MAAKHSSKAATVPAVAYLRMSSDKQTESIPEQRKAVKAYASEQGYHITREYVDSGISGDATEKRFEFQRMIADAASGEFKMILCWDQDRFGRFDSVEAGHWIYPLRQAGVKLETVTAGVVDWDDFAARLLWTVSTEAKHQFLRDLSRNTMRGQMARASTGAWMAKAPLGYNAKGKGKDRRLVLGPVSEVKAIGRVFREYLNGQSLRAIAESLNSDGIPTTGGKKWTMGSVRQRLTNRAYVGDTTWNQRSSGKYHRLVDGKPTAKNGTSPKNPESEWLVFENTHEAIISREDFDAVQVRLKQRAKKRTPHRNGGGYIFTGLLRCSHCGHPMHGSKRGYFCSGYQRHGLSVCRRYEIGQDKLTELVIDAIEGQFCNTDAITELRKELQRQAKSETGRDASRNLRRQLQTVQGRLEKARGRLVTCPDDMFDDMTEQVRKLRTEEAELQASIKATGKPRKQALAEADAKVEAAIAGVQRLREAMIQADTAMVREFLSRLVERIVLQFTATVKGKRSVYRLSAGTLHLHGENLSDMIPMSAECKQVLQIPLPVERIA